MDNTSPVDSTSLQIPKLTQGPTAGFPIYFLSPFPLETCTLCLENKSGKGKYISPKGETFRGEIDVFPVTEDSCRYTLLVTIQGSIFSKRMDVGIEGFLQRWDENFTLVIGKAWASSIRYLWLVLMWVSIPVILITNAKSNPTMGFLGGCAVAIGSAVFWIHDRRKIGSAHQKLSAFLQDTLEAGKLHIAIRRVADEKQLEEEYQE